MRPDVRASARRLRENTPPLLSLGFTHVAGWYFAKRGVVYDLSAADLSQIDRIEEEGLFVVSVPLSL